MKTLKSSNNRFRFFQHFFGSLPVMAGLMALWFCPLASGQTPAVSYTGGILHVTIPYDSADAGTGQLTVEVLDPEGDLQGRAERLVEIGKGKGEWREDVKFWKAPALEDLVWSCLRYRFQYSGEKNVSWESVESISQILRAPTVRVISQHSYLAGSHAVARVVVTDAKNGAVDSGSVRVELLNARGKDLVLFTGKLNRRGSTDAQLDFPAGLVGSYRLRYVVDTAIGSTESIQAVQLLDKVSILLTTEKPIYQPGQTIHVRALAMDRAHHHAAADRSLTFEVQDSRGNKVFKKATQTDQFGVASAEFGLADEVNVGAYHLRAVMEAAGEQPANTAEITLNVEKYVLPKFKVTVDLAGKGAKTRHGYRPGDHVIGTVHASYFFGKPVDHAQITVKASAMDVAVYDAGFVQGKTDGEGAYHFNLTLPDYFAGKPANQGAARVLIEATVKDTSGHAETRGEPITVSNSPLLITVVPEGGNLIPNLENQVYILTAYPDGKPAPSQMTVHVKGSKAKQYLTTDNGGVALIRIHAGAGATALDIDAKDKKGNRTSAQVPLQVRNGLEQILLRAERAVYRVGDRIQLRVFSTLQRGAAYVDIVHEGQTVLTQDLDVENGQAELALTATPEMAGTLNFNAYLFGSDAQVVGDHRLVFIEPADKLNIEATADAAVYKPGGEARVSFRVTDAKGRGVSAALGLQVVDEAVFALAEKQPGFAKVFFYLEQELLKPRFEIHSIGMEEIVAPVDQSQADRRDRAARALFSATEMVTDNNSESKLGGTVPKTKYAEYARRYNYDLTVQMGKLWEKIHHLYYDEGETAELNAVIARMAAAGDPLIRDAWGSTLRIETRSETARNSYWVRSAGPDKLFGTDDDLLVYLGYSEKIASTPADEQLKAEVKVEPNGRAGISTVAGTVVDVTGAVITQAQVILVSTDRPGWERIVTTNDHGEFIMPLIPAGDYALTVSKSGFAPETSLVRLDVNGKQELHVKLRPQAAGAAVAAVGAAPGTVEGNAQNAVVGEVLPNRLVQDIPLTDNSVVGVAQTLPGVNDVNAGGVLGGIVAKQPMPVAIPGRKAAPAPHVRSYFPEALYINPEIITDGDGNASVTIPLADSITTWRMAMLASTERGALGTATSSLKVFQDFFVDLDLPVTLTQGDRVSIPVAVYNYSGARGDVTLQLQSDDWFSLVHDVPDKTIAVDAAQVGGSQFALEAKRIGKFKLTLSARMDGKAQRADTVVREIEVIPNGREQSQVFNGRLESSVRHQLDFPVAAIPESGKIFVRLYPGPLSQVIEGMDSLLRMPYGCFEQTSSSTYPNVLALDYMKRTNKLTPEVRAKAEGYIANGYQRLLTFEVPSGGFSWFGNAPANKILTAYGLMEFYDMSKVHDVDANLISRTQQWLVGQQQADGSWRPDTSFINEGATNRYNFDVLRITAYVAWSLENAGYAGQAVEKAKQYIESHLDTGSTPDTYTLAVLANFAVDYGKDQAFTSRVMQLLLDSRIEEGEQAWWNAAETSVYATGVSASVETTGLAAQALLKWGQVPDVARKALAHITAKKNSLGTWGTTQATIMALRALLLATDKGEAEVRGTLEIALNGQPAAKLALTEENGELFHQFVFKDIDAQHANTVDIRFEGKGGLAYQVVGSWFVPWDKKPESEPLSIDVAYDRTQLAQNDIATATATITNNLPKAVNMVMVDLGIPPGFDLLSEDLQTYLEKSVDRKSGRLEKFTLTATQAILYFDSIAPGGTVTLHFRLRAKYPVVARTFKSRVYEYYDPEVSAVARPVQLEVRPH